MGTGSFKINKKKFNTFNADIVEKAHSERFPKALSKLITTHFENVEQILHFYSR